MYSYNTLYYTMLKNVNHFLNRKIFKKNIDKRNFLRYTKKRKNFLVRVEV